MAKHWCFTLNNYTTEEYDALVAAGEEAPEDWHLQYLIFGKETGEGGTPHLQGFISFTKRKSLNTVKGYVSPRAHLEPAKGTPPQAAAYCKKDGDYVEFGTCPRGQGSRTDLIDVAKKVRAGESLKRLAEDHPESYIRYSTGILRLRSMYPGTRSGPPEIHVFWGKTGSGKTRRVYEFIDRNKLWVHPGDRWFDGYDGQDAVLFDDFDGSWFKIDYLLKLLDRYVFQVPVKGGYTWWVPKHIFITSNKEPASWYPNANKGHQDALKRRLREFGSILEIN